MSDKPIKEHNDDYQQQIIFDEQELDIAAEQAKTQEQQLVFDNDNWLAEQEQLSAELELETTPGKVSWLPRIFFALLLLLVSAEAVDFFIRGFSESPFTTGVYAALFACIVFVTGSVLVRETKGLRQLKRQQHRQNTASRVLASGDAPPNRKFDSQKFCRQISAQLPNDLQSTLEQEWTATRMQEHSDAELLALYSREVLTRVDERALKEIAKFSGEATVLVALSPVAILDMALLFWRNIRMIDKISALYGLKLGYWSRLSLIRQVFVNMVYAGASELIADFGSQMVGAELLGKLSARFSQGLGAGLLTAKLGIKTMHTCRPLPFHEDPPKLNLVRKELQQQLKALLKNSPQKKDESL
ncbi:TIGR01620 family protein [Thalassomonas viridans]|uniref:TIGR01620 family protein n=1 Tax=Thalassomonas viridans TaxID=137584 RepID=A0AAF0CAX0_9GAMM|nr:TIGR01620 family protein [Thalassomonas viridans]WDE06991.1 TIGR01620 family protein [Thalassomonas viridans]